MFQGSVARDDLPTGLLLAITLLSCRGDDRYPDVATTLPGSGAPAGSWLQTPYYRLSASGPRDCSPHHSAARARRVGIEFALEPTGSVRVPANPYYAQLVDGQGTVYEATLGGCGPALAPTLPVHGQIANGWIVFEVPRAARDFTLIYSPELEGAPKSELVIGLTSKAPSPP
jgi:hypothetical protein